jgi:hypothetical protein
MRLFRFGAAKLAQRSARDACPTRFKAKFFCNSNRLRERQQGEARVKKPVADNAIFNARVTSI